MKNRKNKSKHSTLDSIIHHNFLSMNKQLERRDAILLDSGYYAQAELEMDGLIAHPDITSEEKGERGEEGEATEAKTKGQSVIVKLKDTVNGRRLDITDQKFTSYLRQLLYYMMI